MFVKFIEHITISSTEKQIRCLWNWVFTFKSKMIWVSAVLNWVFVKFISGNTTFLLHFLYNTNYFNWVFNISFAFCYPWYSRKNIWVNTPQKQL